MKQNKLSILLRGIIAENPVLILVLGTCPALAVSTSIVSAVSMGIAATLVLIGSNVVISLLRKVIPDSVRIPCYIVVIAAFVTAVQMLMQAYLEPIYDLLGRWLSLIVVNCIVLGRAEMFARKNKPLDSALDGLGMGLGFTVALLAMALVREVFGSGTVLSGLAAFGVEAIKIPFIYDIRIPILAQAPGGFLIFGIMIAVMNKITEKKGGVKRKSFSCDGCPSAHLCTKTSCSEITELASDASEAAEQIKEAEIAEKKEVEENA
ncbi:MAG: electron transport complex subunit E [Clostridia bacterium]|nr:electron transport complex subunit E [Clostridia bacterium]